MIFTFRKERNSGKGSDIACDLTMTKAMMVTRTKMMVTKIMDPRP